MCFMQRDAPVNPSKELEANPPGTDLEIQIKINNDDKVWMLVWKMGTKDPKARLFKMQLRS